MASPGDGPIESADRRNVRPPLLRRQGQSRDRRAHEYHSGDRGGDPLPHARPVAKGISGLPGRRGMNPEYNALDEAVQQIQDENIDTAVIEAAAARVWANLANKVGQALPPANQDHALRTCADFQTAIPDFKSGHLPESRALLVKDHLHECVACRKIYQGNVA